MLCIVVVVTLRSTSFHDIVLKSVRATGSPTVGRGQPASHYRAGNFAGEAPWALSALPECLLQDKEFRAPSKARVLEHLPVAAQPVAAGTVLRFRDCRLEIRAHDAFVTRGKDWFWIPPQTEFFISRGNLLMLRVDRGAELRIYEPSNLST